MSNCTKSVRVYYKESGRVGHLSGTIPCGSINPANHNIHNRPIHCLDCQAKAAKEREAATAQPTKEEELLQYLLSI